MPLLRISGVLSAKGSFDFGNEDDSVLRFSSARLYLGGLWEPERSRFLAGTGAEH